MTARFLAPTALTLAALMAGFPSPAQSLSPGSEPHSKLVPRVASAVLFDLSPPLREMARIPPPWIAAENREREVPNEVLPKARAARGEKRSGIVDSVLQSWPGSGPSMPAPSHNWEGIGNLNGVLPPDTQGDVGLNHYVQWVNLSLAIWDKSGTLVYGPVDGNTLWQGFGGPADTSNDGDPVVVYDRLANRWLISQFALPFYPGGPFYQYIAISQTPDPTGAWYRYAFKVSDTKMNDYPKIGVWPDGYYMSVNQFNSRGWAGAGVFVFDRAKMLAGDPSASFIAFDLYSVDAGYGGMLPAHLSGPTPPPAGAPCPFAEADDEAWGWPHDQFSLWQFHADWTNPSNSTFGLSGDPDFVLQTAPFDTNLCGYDSCVTQQGVTSALDAISDRLMFRLNYLNFGSHQTLATCHTVDADGTDHAGVRWYELRDSGAGWGIYQQGTFAPDSEHRWMGSLAMDKAGDMALGYSVSGADLYPSIRYAGRLPGDPLGEISQSEQTLIAGGGAQTHSSGRWGDYSTMSLDPVDDCTFWYTQEYYASTSSAGWQTRIGAFKFPSCSPTSGPLVTAQAVSPMGVAPLSVTLSASASRGQAPYTYAWTFGDGTSGSGSPVSHTYTALSTYEARVTATDGAGASSSTSVYVSATAPPPVITSAQKLASPLRLKVSGSNFHPDFTLKINGTPVTATYKSSTLVLGKGPSLKALLPKGVAVNITITNNDDGGISAPFSYTR